MPNSSASRGEQLRQALSAARKALARPMDFADFLAKLSPKDRVNAQKRVDVLDAGPDPRAARLWRRLACTLTTLAPHAAKLVGKQTLQIYVADGAKYRKQVFALEDLQDGVMTIYCPDVLADGLAAGVVAPPPPADAEVLNEGQTVYAVASSGEPLRIDSLDGRSVNPAAHYKDMLGWNRKALRITLPPAASPAQIEAAELLCALAAQQFVPAAAATPAATAAAAPPGKP
jgi:hypothetical protein